MDLDLRSDKCKKKKRSSKEQMKLNLKRCEE